MGIDDGNHYSWDDDDTSQDRRTELNHECDNKGVPGCILHCTSMYPVTCRTVESTGCLQEGKCKKCKMNFLG